MSGRSRRKQIDERQIQESTNAQAVSAVTSPWISRCVAPDCSSDSPSTCRHTHTRTAKEMMQPCTLYLHVTSLVGRTMLCEIPGGVSTNTVCSTRTKGSASDMKTMRS